jgi:hypothetical protein
VTQRVIERTDWRTFGVNTLYWIEDDRSRRLGQDQRLQDENGTLAKTLSEINVGMMRFPGGEVADNYDWRTNRLDDPSFFPQESSPDDADSRMDYHEFIKLAGHVGAKANFVVNLEGAYLVPDAPRQLWKFTKRAREWVHQANIEQRYGVKYWEIGNESYLAGTRYSLSAREYAEALIKFSTEMKGIDPSIKIGAIGPFSSTEGGFVDYLNTLGRARFRAMTFEQVQQEIASLGRAGLIAKLNAGQASPGVASWWRTVASLAGNHFDFIVLHRYDNTRLRNGRFDLQAPLWIEQAVTQIRTAVSQHKRGGFEVSVTEWNVGRQTYSQMPRAALTVVIAEQLVHYLRAGVDFANYWPLRVRFGPWPTLLTYQEMKWNPPAVVMKIFSSYMKRDILEVASTDSALEVIASRSVDRKRLSMIILNRSTSPRNVKIAPIGGKPIQARSLVPRADGTGDWVKLWPASNNDRHWITARPLSMTLMVFALQ